MLLKLITQVGIFASILISTSAFADQAQINMECHNNSINVSFKHGSGDNGVGHAISPKIQFNINQDAGPGVIFVNSHNDGVCTASISDGYMITGGKGIIDTSDADVKGGKPSEIVNLIQVIPNTPAFESLGFNVKYIKGTGTANIKFLIDYKSLNQ